MDAGLAAVIAGASGAGGAALAAFATSLGLLRQAKMQGDHAHQQWLRTQQQQALEGFLTSIDFVEKACTGGITEAIDRSRRSVADDSTLVSCDDLAEEMYVQSRAMRLANYRVLLLSDKAVGDSAVIVGKALLELCQVASSLVAEFDGSDAIPPSYELWIQAQERVWAARNDHVLLAGAALRRA